MDLVRLNAKVYQSNAGVYEEIPVLLTQEGVVESNLSYLLDHVHVRSQSWLDKQVTALKLFIQFLDANSQLALTPKEFFKVFVQQLYSGTIGTDGLDPSMLFWMPRRVTTANAIINSLANYSDWLSENRDLEEFSNYGHRYDSNLGTRLNLRDILITLLLNGVGLYQSSIILNHFERRKLALALLKISYL